MKAIIKSIFIIAYLLLSISSTIIAQDLIKSTQLGLNISNDNSVSNRIAQQVEEVRITSKFKTVSLFELSGQQRRIAHQDYITDEVYLDLSTKAVSALLGDQQNAISLTIPVAARCNIELELVQVNIFSPDFQVITSDGNVTNALGSTALFYRGIVKGNSNSIVSLSVFKDHIRAIISDDYGNYVLGQTTPHSNDYILYNDKKLKVSNNFECHTTDSDTKLLDEQIRDLNQNKNNSSGNCIDIYIETDYDTYQKLGADTSNVVAYVADLFHQVCTVYKNEGISIQLSELFIWTSTDIYASLSDIYDVLYTFRSNRQNFNGDLAHFISTRFLGGGIAWLDVLCNRNDGDSTDTDTAHAVSGSMSSTIVPFPTYSWSVMVFCHEMGHNFGSTHTHSCAWNGNNTQIDDCGNIYLDNNPNTSPGSCYDANNPIVPSNGGTIMSYCHIQSVGINLSAGFGQQSGDLIRDRYNNANCKGACNSTCADSLKLIGAASNLYEASNSITATGAIFANQNITFDAGNYVCLIHSFTGNNGSFISDASNGSVFLAHIDGCDGKRIGSNTRETVMDNAKHSPTGILPTPSLTSIKNTPNPFSDHTTFDIQLTEATEVSLEIYDVTGKLMTVLLDNQQLESGQHKISFDASNLSNGIYLYRLATEQESITKKMVLKK